MKTDPEVTSEDLSTLMDFMLLEAAEAVMHADTIYACFHVRSMDGYYSDYLYWAGEVNAKPGH